MEDLFVVPKYGAPVAVRPTTNLPSNEVFKNSPGYTGTPEQELQIENLAACGMSPEEISASLKIHPQLLSMMYGESMETAAARINAQVAKVALGMALSGANADMTKFWLKTRAGWMETKRIETTGKDGGPIEYSEVKQRVLRQLQDELIEAEFTMVDAEKLTK